MIKIIRQLEAYDLCDIFNANKTGLNWKMTPKRSLTTAQLPGWKKEKAHILVLFCCNGDGLELLDPWVIN
jgi:hypothetical protein